MKSLLPRGPADSPPRRHEQIRSRILWAAGFALLTCLAMLIPSLRHSKPRSTLEPAAASKPDSTRAESSPSSRPEFERQVRLVPGAAPDVGFTRLTARLLDETESLETRRQAALALARLGSDDAFSSLKSALGKGPPYLNAAIAEGLGECTNAAAQSLLSDLSASVDEVTARGAIRGLGLRGDSQSVENLGRLLNDAGRPLSVRTEAALALGNVDQPGALELLTSAATGIRDQTLVDNVLQGLGKRPFAETEQFFKTYLDSEDVTVDSRTAALEALGQAPGNVAPFLLDYLNDPNPDLREAAAWALRLTDDAQVGAQLAAALKQEQNPSVRTRMYQALESQDGADPVVVLALVRMESNTPARLAGLEYLAGTLRHSAAPDVEGFFEQTAVPELKNMALKGRDPQTRLASVLALTRAGTPAALGALQEIAGQASDPTVVQAVGAALSNQLRK